MFFAALEIECEYHYWKMGIKFRCMKLHSLCFNNLISNWLLIHCYTIFLWMGCNCNIYGLIDVHFYKTFQDRPKVD